ncbi:MAG: hypothetical protein IJY24_02040 [Clostridia bacterium]|nr:hypothetical protein [Clostridia bacterium]
MILTINEAPGIFSSICSILNILDMPSYGAEPEEAFSERGDIYRAIILPEPYSRENIRETTDRLRAHFQGAKLYKIGPPDTEEAMLFDSVLYPSGGHSAVSNILDTLLSSSFFSPGLPDNLIEAPRRGSARVCGITLPLTKTEGMLLRCLALVYPARLSAEELLKYCMKPGSYTEGTAIRTHISIINKKARSLGLDYVIIGEERGYTVNLSFDRKV